MELWIAAEIWNDKNTDSEEVVPVYKADAVKKVVGRLREENAEWKAMIEWLGVDVEETRKAIKRGS